MTEININDIISYKVKYRRGYSLGGFYLIVNMLNNKAYIGKSMDYMARLKQHTYKSNNRTEIDKAINEFGINSFKYYLLDDYVRLDINHFNRKLETIYEHRFITFHKTFHPHGYNQRYYGHL